ncbi:LAETG motif-containing sortase-dependent surface protein [Kitasatospora sp. NBC_00315]|uniref:LAETG motif-containing sortase-dependent surface protein n=1 Tax=Kitasatospora sp. NBC_00315 TaxID=2975963 RepID=UPI0032507A91
MSATTTNRSLRRSRTAAVATGALGALLAAGSSLATAPAAEAAPAKVELSVQAPASVGGAGRPVAFSETITNPGTESGTFGLALDAVTGPGTPPNGLVIDYRDPADGSWKSVPLTPADAENTEQRGTVPGDIPVPAGGQRTVQLRIGAPLGTPHHGATNGGFASIRLHSALVARPVSVPAETVAENTSTIKVDSVSTALAGVPATAVAGGAPIEFDAVLANPTPSDYVNVGNVLFADRHATVQVRKADGTWATLAPVSGKDAEDRPGFYLEGRDSGIRAGATTTTRVRVSFAADTPVGTTTLAPCVLVNEWVDMPFVGTTMCERGTDLKITAAASSPAPTASPTATAPVTASPSATATAATTAPAPTAAAADEEDTAGAPSTDQLAHTGAGSAPLIAALAAALVTFGAGAFWLARRRRNA